MISSYLLHAVANKRSNSTLARADGIAACPSAEPWYMWLLAVTARKVRALLFCDQFEGTHMLAY